MGDWVMDCSTDIQSTKRRAFDGYMSVQQTLKPKWATVLGSS